MKPVPVSFQEIMHSAPWEAMEAFAPDFVLGIERGGAVLAAVAAYMLGSRLLSVRASRYDDAKPAGIIHDEPLLDGADLFSIRGKKVLIVDDVSNSGKTLAAVKRLALSAGAAEARTFVYAGKADYSCRPFEACLAFPWEWRGKAGR